MHSPPLQHREDINSDRWLPVPPVRETEQIWEWTQHQLHSSGRGVRTHEVSGHQRVATVWLTTNAYAYLKLQKALWSENRRVHLSCLHRLTLILALASIFLHFFPVITSSIMLDWKLHPTCFMSFAIVLWEGVRHADLHTPTTHIQILVWVVHIFLNLAVDAGCGTCFVAP